MYRYRSRSRSSNRRLRDSSSDSEREEGHKTKRSNIGNHAPAALIWYNTSMQDEDEPKKVLGYMRLVRTVDEKYWSDPYMVLSQEVPTMFADQLPDRIVQNEYYLLAMECLKTALSGLHQPACEPGWRTREDMQNNITKVHDTEWADTFMEESEVMRNCASLRDLPANMETHLILAPIIKPIAQFVTALCGGLENSDGRHGVACLLNVLKYVIERSIPELTQFVAGSYTVKSVGRKCSPNDACVSVAYINGDASDRQLEVEELKYELLTRDMKIEHQDGQHTPVPDVNLLYAPPRGPARHKEVVLTVDIKSSAAAVRPAKVAWLQGLTGLKHGQSSYCLTITPKNACLQSLELCDSNVLLTNMRYYTLCLFEKGTTPRFVVENFLSLVHDCMKVIYFHGSSHHEQS